MYNTLMSFSDYAAFDGLGLAALVRERKVSSRELVDEALLRIQRVNARLHAVVRSMPNEAQSVAERTLPQGAFAGVPFLLKDFATAYAGIRLTNGSRLFRDFVPTHDAELVTRYKSAGLIVVGKTTLPEFGLRPVCESEMHGATSTPWRLGRTSGGSSGGSAAAVASGIVPMAHGGDGGGSLRIPASCCGLFALKPSRGRMPTGPDSSEHWWGYASEHAITRTVRDSAALLDATCGAMSGDFYDLPRPVVPYAQEVGVSPGKLRVLLLKQPFLPGKLHPDCALAVERTAHRLEALGHIVEEGSIPVDATIFGRDFFLLVCLEAANILDIAATCLGRKPRKSEVETASWLCAVMGRQANAHAWTQARNRLHALNRRMAEVMKTYDILLSPTVAAPPLTHFAMSPKHLERWLHKIVVALDLGFLLRLPWVADRTVESVFSFMSFTPLANVTGQPSMSVPLDWNEEGLPIGSMFSARVGDEATLFRLAAQLESAHPWIHRKPPIHSDGGLDSP